MHFFLKTRNILTVLLLYIQILDFSCLLSVRQILNKRTKVVLAQNFSVVLRRLCWLSKIWSCVLSQDQVGRAIKLWGMLCGDGFVPPEAQVEMRSSDTMSAWAGRTKDPSGSSSNQQDCPGSFPDKVSSRAITILSPLLAVLGKSQLCPWFQLTLHKDDFYSSFLSPWCVYLTCKTSESAWRAKVCSKHRLACKNICRRVIHCKDTGEGGRGECLSRKQLVEARKGCLCICQLDENKSYHTGFQIIGLLQTQSNQWEPSYCFCMFTVNLTVY